MGTHKNTFEKFKEKEMAAVYKAVEQEASRQGIPLPQIDMEKILREARKETAEQEPSADGMYTGETEEKAILAGFEKNMAEDSLAGLNIDMNKILREARAETAVGEPEDKKD